jgi:hypothetical protein
VQGFVCHSFEEDLENFRKDNMTQQISTWDGAKGMALLRQTVKGLQKEVEKNKESKTVTVGVNGRTCDITAVAGERGGIKITAEYSCTSLESRICQWVAAIEYDRKYISADLGKMVEQIDEIDRTSAKTKVEKIARFTTILDRYVTNGIELDDFPILTYKICQTLEDIQIFVQQNDLTPDETLTLKTALINFSRDEKVIRLYPGHSSSINASTHSQYCFNIALRVEAIEILFDAKEKGYVRLERNGPLEPLGKGRYNPVQSAFTQEGQPIVLKPCDLLKYKPNSVKIKDDSQVTKQLVGCGCGSYRRSKATSRLQDTLCAIGEGLGITVPRVMASVSGAEANGVPYIAMELVEGPSSWQAATGGKIKYNNDYISRETWMQLMDILLGQLDRHGHNVILKDDKPVAIDHDCSFPTFGARIFAYTIPETLQAIDGLSIDGQMSRSYCMPPVIDENMHKVIMTIDLDALENMYRECGLTKHEIEPAMARARALKAEAEKFAQKGRVIDPNDWEQSKKVKRLCTTKNFYALWHKD